jgi:hypothetical protein
VAGNRADSSLSLLCHRRFRQRYILVGTCMMVYGIVWQPLASLTALATVGAGALVYRYGVRARGGVRTGRESCTGTAISYIPERAWNERGPAAFGKPAGLWATGGGTSMLYKQPSAPLFASFQTGTLRYVLVGGVVKSTIVPRPWDAAGWDAPRPGCIVKRRLPHAVLAHYKRRTSRVWWHLGRCPLFRRSDGPGRTRKRTVAGKCELQLIRIGDQAVHWG